MGLFDSLFGGSDYGAGADKSAATGAYNRLGDIGSSLWGAGQQNLNQWGQDNARARQATANYASYLQQDPYTDSRDAADLSRATAGTQGASSRAYANALANLAGRGLDTASSGGASSVLGGAAADIAAREAGTLGQAQNELAYNRINARGQRMSTLADLYTGQSGRELGQAGQLGGQAGSLFGNEAQGYGGLYGQDVQHQQADSQGLMQLLGAGASVAGNMYGMGQASKMFGGMGAGAGAAAGGFTPTAEDLAWFYGG